MTLDLLTQLLKAYTKLKCITSPFVIMAHLLIDHCMILTVDLCTSKLIRDLSSDGV